MKKPKTEREWTLYRARMNCQIGGEAITGKMIPPDGVGRVEYALYCLLHSIEDVAAAMGTPANKGRKCITERLK
jgi:hypothetical protein